MKSRYWIGVYLDGVDGGPAREHTYDTLRQARAAADRIERRDAGVWCRILRLAPDGNLYDLRSFRSCLPPAIQESLAAQGVTPAI